MSLMDKMMEFMAGKMSKEDKQQMMDRMMKEFFTGMTVEDKKKMMAEMMPKMMEGINMKDMMPQMMVAMMGGGQSGQGWMSRMMGMMSGKQRQSEQDEGKKDDASQQTGTKPASANTEFCHGHGMRPQMMLEMMPHCLEMMLPCIPRESRTEFILKMFSVLLEKGTAGMSDKEKQECADKIADKLKTI
ncbi:MAG: hypothetical protein PHO26_00320 [Dehalococcoidia bacterium]|nr:hypothetical protein [Dehalococcoidia bacterium]MDD5493842.1 hypothetical protein [Dehalococcoidia bacterium]